jgi:hypothetical protein
MIDWGQTPVNSTAHIYWPQVNAADVLALAGNLYSHHALSAADAHTIECRVTRGVTYVPIPPGTSDSFAGLLTVDLPTTVVAGQEFNVVVRRVTTRRNIQTVIARDKARVVNTRTDLPSVPGRNQPPDNPEGPSVFASQTRLRNWRYVTGTFQIKIPVGTPATLLDPERNTLAVFKWRLQAMSPANRWYPVLQRYVIYLSARVNELGGNADAIPPSPLGYWEAPPGRGDETGKTYTGRITDVIFGCNGRMEGFVLRECCDREFRFKACDRDLEGIVLQSCTGRFLVVVHTRAKDPQAVHQLIVRG